MMNLLLSPQFTELSSRLNGRDEPTRPNGTVRYGPARSVQAGGKVPPQADCKVFFR